MATGTRLTLEEFLARPEAKPALEYADGMVDQKVPPQGRHSWLQASLLRLFDSAGERSSIALPELRITVGGASRVPDISVFRVSRFPRGDGGEVEDDIRVPTDIAVEIASPQSVNALMRKCRWYVAHGVQIAVLVDPDDRSVIAFRAQGKVDEWTGSDDIDLAEVLPKLELTVEALFAVLKP